MSNRMGPTATHTSGRYPSEGWRRLALTGPPPTPLDGKERPEGASTAISRPLPTQTLPAQAEAV